MNTDVTIWNADDIVMTDADGNEIVISQASLETELDKYDAAHGGERMWRLVAGQLRDDRWREGSDLIYASRPVQITNEATGQVEKQFEHIGPFGKRLAVLPLDYIRNRNFQEAFDPSNPNKEREQYCHSENGVLPDAQYKGRYSHQCVNIDKTKGPMYGAICPYAKWVNAEDGGKNIKPGCEEQYIVACVFSWEGEMIVAEAVFRSASAKSGKAVQSGLARLKLSGQPLWSHPLDLILTEVKTGNTYMGSIRYSLDNDFDEAAQKDIQLAVGRWAEAKAFREERRKRLPETGASQLNKATADTTTVTLPSTPVVPTPTGSNKPAKPLPIKAPKPPAAAAPSASDLMDADDDDDDPNAPIV